MPTYEYACAKCGEHFEEYQSFSDEPLKRHQGCGGKLSKVFGSVGIVLKGSGFYRTDSRTSAGSAESAKPETKPEPKAETKAETTKKADSPKKAEKKSA